MFHNIFSKKSEKAPEIIIDIHEKNSLVPSELSKLNIKYKFEPLKVADYIIGETAIERKTIADLKSSIINKRIFSQLEEIKQCPKPLLPSLWVNPNPAKTYHQQLKNSPSDQDKLHDSLPAGL